MEIPIQFKEAIKNYLDQRAASDPLFAASYAKTNKSIDECCEYLVGEAYDRCKSEMSIMDDATTYGLAVHYYDEDNIEIKKLPSGAQFNVSQGATYEPTEEEKEEARKAALKRLEDEAYQKMRAPKKNRKQDEPVANAGVQASLFDLMQ